MRRLKPKFSTLETWSYTSLPLKPPLGGYVILFWYLSFYMTLFLSLFFDITLSWSLYFDITSFCYVNIIIYWIWISSIFILIWFDLNKKNKKRITMWFCLNLEKAMLLKSSQVRLDMNWVESKHFLTRV